MGARNEITPDQRATDQSNATVARLTPSANTSGGRIVTTRCQRQQQAQRSPWCQEHVPDPVLCDTHPSLQIVVGSEPPLLFPSVPKAPIDPAIAITTSASSGKHPIATITPTTTLITLSPF
jgi:hypothetical protein